MRLHVHICLLTIYTITYNVIDSSGNYVNKIRKVIIRDLIRTLIYNTTNIGQITFGTGRKGTFINGLINTSINYWYIKQFALTSLDFNFSVAWKIILKVKLSTNSSPAIGFIIDPLSSNLSELFKYYIQFGGDEIGGSSYGLFKINLDDTGNIFGINTTIFTQMQTGVYIEIIYNLANITINFLDLSGTIIYNWVSPITITYINNYTPFTIYINSDTFSFYNGILYDITSTKLSTYTTFKSRFNII